MIYLILFWTVCVVGTVALCDLSIYCDGACCQLLYTSFIKRTQSMTGHRSFIPSNRHTARQTFRAAVLYCDLHTKVGTEMVWNSITNRFVIAVESLFVWQNLAFVSIFDNFFRLGTIFLCLFSEVISILLHVVTPTASILMTNFRTFRLMNWKNGCSALIIKYVQFTFLRNTYYLATMFSALQGPRKFREITLPIFFANNMNFAIC
jgi:hypothetical protein